MTINFDVQNKFGLVLCIKKLNDLIKKDVKKVFFMAFLSLKKVQLNDLCYHWFSCGKLL